MKKVIVYGKPGCSFCIKAKEFLDNAGIVYEDRVVGLRYTGEQVREHCSKLSEGAQITTVPQIILVEDGVEKYIGGYTDLMAWHNSGKI